jgi:two-component system sensor histidine kinase KdpD
VNDQRVNPETLLKRVQAEELEEQRGKLKIYLGAAPGVGKTYSMLEDANEKRRHGLDVVVGVVESHGRKDIEVLLDGLEILPKATIDYKGIKLEEFDLDAALRRNPGLILIDEMAHSNVSGTRHAKRWQDIKELLDRGIDVYTTLNVQHIESLNNDVAGIIHAPIKETVPDSIIERADTIELVDLPPEDLLRRLQDGKVYFPSQAAIAKDKFFRKGNLIALRELALRITAERVGAQVLLYRQGQGIKHVWSSSEKILVCVGPGTDSLKLIRSARRLATTLQSTWIAVYVDSPLKDASDDERNKAIKNLRVAEQLGAETTILMGLDIVKEIMNYAREQNITLIMVWKHIVPRWQDIFKKRLADEVVRHSEEINVYIITGNTLELDDQHKKRTKFKLTLSYLYLLAVGAVVLATCLNFFLYKFLATRNIVIIYIVTVTLIALLGRIGPSLLAAVLSFFAYNWFFFPYLFTFSATNFEYMAILLLTIWLGQVISNLTLLNRKQAESARASERKATALHRLSRKLASARGSIKLLEIGANYIAELFDADVMVLMPENQELVAKVLVNTHQTLGPKELGVAQWVFDLGQIAGLGTDTLPEADAVYVPLLASQNTMGVLRIHPKHPEQLFTPDQMHFLETCANQIALTIEVDRLQEHRKKVEIEKEIDHTRNILLQSVSQDLRAPLAAIMLTASTQMQMSRQLSSDRIISFGQTIYSESEQLSRLINNLLQITYLESAAVKLQKEPSSLQDLVVRVIKTSRDKLGKTPVYIHIPPEIPLIRFDQVLMEGVFLNLLDNAIKFAPKDQTIEIFAVVDLDRVVISVEDRGPGIDGDEQSKLFEKFYRGRMLTSKRGLGLGLAICRIIIEAHGGQIWAQNRVGGGSAFKFSLPL